ncbi:MAG: flagellar hook-length control protein FliK [Thermodesulfobacteria bacterium]|nr:flagellar hook-length control protein FliK [Thermodesulfobacteriota bacterium]
MIVPKVTSTAAVRFLPENLVSLLRPGQTVSAKVETIKGRLLTLQVGEERLEALIEEKVPLKLFKPGQHLRLKVVSNGPPVVLSLMLPESDHPPRLHQLMKSLLSQVQRRGKVEEEKEPTLEKLFLRFLETIEKEDDQGRTNWARELKDPIIKHWQEGVLFLPLVFGDRISWAYLFEERRKSSREGERLFVLRLFLSRAGFLEARFRLVKDALFLELYFAREEALILARKMLEELRDTLQSKGLKAHVTVASLSALPGAFLNAAG